MVWLSFIIVEEVRFIHSFAFSNRFVPVRVTVNLPGTLRQREMPVYYRTLCTHKSKKKTKKKNIAGPPTGVFFHNRRKLDNPEETHLDMRRTCNTELTQETQAQDWTEDAGAVSSSCATQVNVASTNHWRISWIYARTFLVCFFLFKFHLITLHKTKLNLVYLVSSSVFPLRSTRNLDGTTDLSSRPHHDDSSHDIVVVWSII